MCLQRFGTCVREHKASLIPRPPCQCLLVCRDKSYEGLTKRLSAREDVLTICCAIMQQECTRMEARSQDTIIEPY